jgi:hypothetical protein
MRSKRSTYKATRRFSVVAILPGTEPATAVNWGKIFVADRPCTVLKFSESHEALSTDPGAGVILERLQGTEVSGAGDAITAESDLTAAINTVQTPALVGGGEEDLAIGDRLNIIDNVAGLTALKGVCITVELEEGV